MYLDDETSAYAGARTSGQLSIYLKHLYQSFLLYQSLSKQILYSIGQAEFIAPARYIGQGS